jgi:hypothetical protein
VKKTYPLRLSTYELRDELAGYLAERTRAGSSDATVDLDRRKVEYVLHWLDTGELPS